LPLKRLSTGTAYTSAGAMNICITLLLADQQRTPDGEFLPWEKFASTWASIRAMTGRDLEKAQQVVAEVTHKVVIRYMPGVLAKMLVQLPDGRIFLIQAIMDPDERKVELWLLCKERNDGAYA
jgi:SPP1 family predicted phage head-tail adaptor